MLIIGEQWNRTIAAFTRNTLAGYRGILEFFEI